MTITRQLPQLKLGRSPKLGRENTNEINALPQLPQLPQLDLSRPCACEGQRDRQAALSSDLYLKLGQLGQLGQRVENSAQFERPNLKKQSIDLGQLGHPPRHGSFPAPNCMRGGVAREFASHAVGKTGFTMVYDVNDPRFIVHYPM